MSVRPKALTRESRGGDEEIPENKGNISLLRAIGTTKSGLDTRIEDMQKYYQRMESRNRGRSPSPSGHGLFHQTGAMTGVAMAAAQAMARLNRRPNSADSDT